MPKNVSCEYENMYPDTMVLLWISPMSLTSVKRHVTEPLYLFPLDLR